MPLDLDCPKCRHVFPVTEARHPVGVQCPGCDAELTAEFRRLPVPAPGQPHYELLVSPGRPPGATQPPAAAGKALRLDDDEDGGKKRKGGSMIVVVLAGLGVLAVTLGGLGATGYVLFTNLDVPESTTPNRPAGGTGRPGGNSDPPRKGDKPGPSPDRQEFVSGEWGFAAKFPAPPATRRQTTAGTSSTAFVAEGPDGACMVMVADLPIGDNETTQQTRDRLQVVQDGAVRSAGGTLRASSSVTLGRQKYPGREFTASASKPVTGQLRSRIYLVGKRLYQVTVLGANAHAGPDAKAFLDSFRLAE